jgi:hypothetical protein
LFFFSSLDRPRFFTSSLFTRSREKLLTHFFVFPIQSPRLFAYKKQTAFTFCRRAGTRNGRWLPQQRILLPH